MSYRDNISGISFIVKKKERLPYGNKDRGRLVPSEKGRRTIFVPSWGTMEKEEVDYIVGTAQEQEDERIKKGYGTETGEVLEKVAQAGQVAPKGKRAETMREIINQ